LCLLLSWLWTPVVLQARRVEAALVDPRTLLEMSLSDEPRPSTGMIPSQQLEEKRKAFVRPEFDYTQKSRESLRSDRSYRFVIIFITYLSFTDVIVVICSVILLLTIISILLINSAHQA